MKVPEQMESIPLPGHAVRLTDEWPWARTILEVGKIGIINGIEGIPSDQLHICWNHSTFRGWGLYGAPECDARSPLIKTAMETGKLSSAIAVSSSGGPATIALPAHLLKPTDEIVTVQLWCWRDIPRANGGRSYIMSVPLWEWDGKGY